MHTHQAKKLKVGDEVIWSKPGDVQCNGRVVYKHYDTIDIHWSDAEKPNRHYANLMPHVYTAEQLKQMADEKSVASKMEQVKAEMRKREYAWN